MTKRARYLLCVQQRHSANAGQRPGGRIRWG